MREARIAAPHALAAMIFTAFQARSAGRWQCHIEIAVSSLRAIQAPLDLLDMWNRMVDALEEPDANNTDGIITEGELPQDLSRGSRGSALTGEPYHGVIGRCFSWN